MTQNYIQKGDIIEYQTNSDIKSGDLIIIGAIAGIAITDIKKNESGSVKINGVFQLPKIAEAISQGDKLYFDKKTTKLTKKAADNNFIGIAVTSQTTDSITVNVLLNKGK